MIRGWKDKEEQSQEPSSSSAAEGTQLMNDEVNQVVDCIMNRLSSELVNFQSTICDSLPQENVDPKVCSNTSVLGCPGSSANYEDCMEAEVGNTKMENVSDEDCLKETILSHQFPMFFTSTDNQLASKAKDSLEDRKKKGSGGSNKKKKKKLGSLWGAFRGNFMFIVGFGILLLCLLWLSNFRISEVIRFSLVIRPKQGQIWMLRKILYRPVLLY
jgi:hypothetical protein